MSTTFRSAGAFAAFFAVTVLAWNQYPIRDDMTDDLMPSWCSIGSSQSWEGRPCVVPLEPRSANGKHFLEAE